MAKKTKSEKASKASKTKVERAERSRVAAVAALADAEEVRTALGGGGKKLAADVQTLTKVAGVTVKRLARHPKRTRRQLEKATADVAKRVRRARQKQRPDAADRAGDAGDPSASAPASDVEVLAQAQADVLPAADLSGLTLYELRRRAKEEGRVGYSRLSKAELVALLT